MKFYSAAKIDHGMDRYDYLCCSFHVDVDLAFRGRGVPNWPHCFVSLTFRHETDVFCMSGEGRALNQIP